MIKPDPKLVRSVPRSELDGEKPSCKNDLEKEIEAIKNSIKRLQKENEELKANLQKVSGECLALHDEVDFLLFRISTIASGAGI